MRILLVFHGWFPGGDRPSSGGALRAWHHAEALAEAGHEVIPVTRKQDRVPGGPATFSSGEDLTRMVRELSPEAIVCVQPEEAPHLAVSDIPLVVDLYAPRMVEAQYQGADHPAAVRTLQALSCADLVLFSNRRQRWYYLGLMVLAGVDVREGVGEVVPLVAADGPPRRTAREPRFVFGGVHWPWVDPADSLRRAAAHLEHRDEGRVVVYGGAPAHGSAAGTGLGIEPGPRLELAGVVSYPRLLAAYARATAALDLVRLTPERELALSFRQMDYLGCGLPLITHEHHLLADRLRSAGAGIVGEPVERALDRVLDDPAAHRRRMRAARRLAREHFSRERAEAPLLAWLENPRTRQHPSMLLGTLAEAWARVSHLERRSSALEVERDLLRAEIRDKRTLVERLNRQVQSLTHTVSRLSEAVGDVSSFKQEAIQVLDRDRQHVRGQAEHLSRELSIARADIAKKTAEVQALVDEQRRLENDLVHARREIERLRRRRIRIG